MTSMFAYRGLKRQEAYFFAIKFLPTPRTSDSVPAMAITAPAEPRPTKCPPEHWLNVEEAAKFFRTSPRTIYRLTAKGLIPYRQLPGTASKAFAPEDLRDITDMSLIRSSRP